MDKLEEHNKRQVGRKAVKLSLPKISSRSSFAIFLFLYLFIPQSTFSQITHLDVEGDVRIRGTLEIGDTSQSIESGYSVEFDGIDDFIKILSTYTFTNKISIGFYLKWDGSDSSAYSILNRGNSYGIRIDNSSGTGALEYVINNCGSYVWNASGINITPNTWTHVFLVQDGTNIDIYINGISSFSTACSNSITTLYDTTFISTSEYSFLGKIDELQIWDIGLNSTQVNQYIDSLVGIETGLIGYWDFQDGTGSTATDLTSNNNDGELVNGTSWSNLDIINPANGIILSSPNGKKWRVRVDNNGNLSVEQVD